MPRRFGSTKVCSRSQAARVGELLCAKMKVHGGFENVATPGGAAIIERKNDVALLRHHLVPQESSGARPGVQNNLGVRAAVGERNNRGFLRGIEIGRLDHRAIQRYAVVRLDGEK